MNFAAKPYQSGDPGRAWLGAYLDGELSRERRAWVEMHLGECAACRRELAELRALTHLLQADPAPGLSLAPADFAAQVLDRLPPRRPSTGAWWVTAGLHWAPVILFTIWVFFQAVSGLMGALLLAANLFPPARAGVLALLPFLNLSLQLTPPSWLVDGLVLAGLEGQAGAVQQVYQSLGSLPLTGPLGAVNLAVTIVCACLFLAWLAGWWSYRRSQAGEA